MIIQPAAAPSSLPWPAAAAGSRPGDDLDRARALLHEVLDEGAVVDLHGWVHDGVLHYEADKSRRRAALQRHLPGIAAALRWLKSRRSRQTINRRRSGAEWVKAAEQWNTERGMPVEIPLGCFLVAVRSNWNFKVEVIGQGPDFYVNIREKAAYG